MTKLILKLINAVNVEKVLKKINELFSESKPWIKASLFIFLFAMVFGIINFFFRGIPTFSVIYDSLAKISELGNQAKDLGSLGKFFLIYQNNLISLSIALFGGFILGIFSLITIFVNGLILGFFPMLLFFSPQISFSSGLILFIMLFPHGIIELFMLIFATAWGLKLGIEYLLPKSRGKRLSIFIKNLKNSFWIFIFLSIGLAVAAGIEVLDMKILEILIR